MDHSNHKAPVICEIAWEVCQQLGGIYTVLRSRAPRMVEKYGSHYCLIGPYNAATAAIEFEEAIPRGPFRRAIEDMRELGIKVHYGTWLVSGRPRVILFESDISRERLSEVKYYFWKNHNIATPPYDDLVDRVLAFGECVSRFFEALAARSFNTRPVVAHFHEWMGGSAIPDIRHRNVDIKIVFTTHATLLGRYLATADSDFYSHMHHMNWAAQADRFNIRARVEIERAAAHGAHIFTTVSDVTASECKAFLGRDVDMILPNGLNIERFVAYHEFQNLHIAFKEKINRFIMGYFFPKYCFDLDHTLYFFTSGRYEFRNKGFDMTIESLARLNYRLKKAGRNVTVVAFFITKQPFHSIRPEALSSRAMLEEIRNVCTSIQNQVGERLFLETAMGRRPSFDTLVDEYWTLRLRRDRQTWQSGGLPSPVTHDLLNPWGDELLNQLKACQLLNRPEDPVKVIYHPDFITADNPLFAIDYDQFVRGCHLGVFPSYYEPWGYTPLECIARGIPAITSDLSGFGSYLPGVIEDHEKRGIYLLNRRTADYHAAADQLCDMMFKFTELDRRERISLRNAVEQTAIYFDWEKLASHYFAAYEMAVRAR